MPQDKDIRQMTTAELRAELAEFERSSQPAGPQRPDAPGCADLTQAARDAASAAYGDSAMGTQAGQLSPAQRDFLRQSIAATLHEMGN
jgi:hypothetical protein